ncbi:universal stress protein [Dactylosporangium siamense]|uniref:Universal stress protein n=1 Tax=Dactylosporangium siamense TaxID=685454 RepID=A0A919Q043_9ACTN|nr:universal stress protein [Dactylosporangium siamense]GIG52446.1 universal stress protein [Dactylosporangium siamense]
MNSEPIVVVGVDGSPASLDAVGWAAADAVWRRCRLQIVHAFVWPAVYAPVPAPVPSPFEEGVRAAAERTLTVAAGHARAVASGLEVRTELQLREPAEALVEASRHAATVVVGHRGHGGFTSLLLGSVGAALAAHAACPVVIVRREDRPAGTEAGRVVVGVDGSHDAEAALRFAFEEASHRSVGLTAAHVYQWPVSTGPGDMLPLVYDLDDLREDEQRALSESMAGWSGKYPDLDVRHTLVRGRPAAVLTELSAGAELLVVGSRGRGGFAGLLLGSVSQAAIRHAACPVAVVR